MNKQTLDKIIKKFFCRHNEGYLIENEKVYCSTCQRWIGYVKANGDLIINTTYEIR